jgi:type IV pilus assembly protein PilC
MTALTYDYRARDKSGTIHSGQMEGSSPSAVAGTLREKGYIPLRIDARKSTTLQKDIQIPGFKKKVKTKDIAIFSRQLSTMVNSGLTLIRALTILDEQTDSPVLKRVLGEVRTTVEQGSSLSAALEAHPTVFSNLYVSMVRAGEVGGALDETLVRLADTLEASVRLRSKVKSAMAYPLVVLTLIIVIVTGMLVFVVPIFEGMYSELGGTLPAPTQLLIVISSIVTGFWWLIVSALIGSIVGFKRWKKTESGLAAWDRLKVKLPVFGQLVQKIAISRFARTFAVLSRTGVPVLQTLDIVSSTSGNWLMSEATKDIQASVKRGESLVSPLHRHKIFPPMVTHMMAVGEETGALDTMLAKVADFYDAEVEDTVNAMTSLIEPLLIVVMGVVVGGILISLYLPMFNIANLIQ